MNKVILIGNLTRDPEVTQTSSGISVCRLSIAVNRRFASADGTRDVDFFNITCWRGLADNCGKYLKKGKKIGVTGSLQTRSYEAQDGTKRQSIEIQADDIEFLSPLNSNSSDDFSESKPSNEYKPIEDEDLPF